MQYNPLLFHTLKTNPTSILTTKSVPLNNVVTMLSQPHTRSTSEQRKPINGNKSNTNTHLIVSSLHPCWFVRLPVLLYFHFNTVLVLHRPTSRTVPTSQACCQTNKTDLLSNNNETPHWKKWSDEDGKSAFLLSLCLNPSHWWCGHTSVCYSYTVANKLFLYNDHGDSILKVISKKHPRSHNGRHV